MEKGLLSVLVIVIVTLMVVILSYFDLKSSVVGRAPVAARTSITVQGVGSTVTFTTGGGSCTGSRQPVVAHAAISNGFTGNTIRGTASCGPGTTPAIVTASGLIFVASTDDSRLRALDVKTGKQLWESRLQRRGNANPMTYMGANGKQYVVIAATDTVVAYQLP